MAWQYKPVLLFLFTYSRACINQLVLFLHFKYILFIIKKGGLPEFLKDLATSPVKHFVSAGRLQTEKFCVNNNTNKLTLIRAAIKKCIEWRL
jgi:hypothetical protein